MKDGSYIKKAVGFFHAHKALKKILIFVDKAAPLAVTWSFYVTASYLAVRLDLRVIFFLLIPWLNFVAVTAVRNRLDLTRPFQEQGFEPVIPHSPGKSCPSRHASSSAVISMAVYYICPAGGRVLAVISVVICISRVLTGVHYARDVLIGAAAGFATGYIGFFVLL